jgi:Flp pilus assembly CpaE family ATPase
VCADLSGNLEKYSMEIMHESRKIFVVCTPEIASLHLAREKLQYLQRMDLGDRACVLLNRYVKKSSVTPTEVEQIVGAPVEIAFPNDYTRVNRAIQEGKGVDPASELGKCYAELGAYMLQKKLTAPEASRRRFVEYFNITPARFSLERSRG